VTVYALVILFAGYAFLDAIMQALAAPTALMRLGVGRDLRRSDHHRSPGIGSRAFQSFSTDAMPRRSTHPRTRPTRA
jgi:hypothetical protein